MPTLTAGPLHAYLAGTGSDSRGRSAADALAFSDEQLEEIHDYIQWLFPLPTRSAAQPMAPVLTQAEILAIRDDPAAAGTLAAATERMLRFYSNTHWWLVRQDHNHLRITRIIRSLKILVGESAARRFHDVILSLHDAAGAPINGTSLRYWDEALLD
jgi:hypothetical protein